MNVPWNNDYLVSIVRDFEKLIEVPHNTLKGITHEIERAIGVNDGILLEGAKIFLADNTIVQLGLASSAREAAAAAG
jgi:hypothetical protein